MGTGMSDVIADLQAEIRGWERMNTNREARERGLQHVAWLRGYAAATDGKPELSPWDDEVREQAQE